MHVDRNLHHLLKCRDQLPSRLRTEQSRRVLDHDLVAAHVHEAFRHGAPQLEVVRRRDRVAERALHPLLGLQCGRDRSLHVAEVVKGVENAEDVDSVLGRVLDEELDHVIRKVPFRDQILAADQGLDRRVRRCLVQLAEKFPRVLVDDKLYFKRGTAKRFHGRKAKGIHLRGDGYDLLGPQIAAEKGLLRVAERRVDEPDSGLLLRH